MPQGSAQTKRTHDKAKYHLARAWQAVWGFPQTAVGLAMYAAHKGWRQHGRFRSAIVTEWNKDAGLSLGMFIFVPRGVKRSLVVHEYGHTIQSLMLGPFYLPVIVLPSLLWAGLPAFERFRQNKDYSYYRLYPERWANLMARRVTKERPMGWYR